MLLQAEGLTGAAPPAAVEVTPTPAAHEPHSWHWPPLVAQALAQSATAEPADVDQLLEHYRSALEHADVDAYASVYSSFSAAQRSAIHAYFENAQGLRVRISNVELRDGATGPVVSFVRADEFLDRASGRHAQLEVRLLKPLVRSESGWKFAPPVE